MACPSVETIRAALLARYSAQFGALPEGQVTAAIEDARLMVPCCNLGDRATLACVYKAASLLITGVETSLTGGGGGVKRKRDLNVEIEYFGTGTTGGGAAGRNNFEALYQELIKGSRRLSPMILDGH